MFGGIVLRKRVLQRSALEQKDVDVFVYSIVILMKTGVIPDAR